MACATLKRHLEWETPASKRPRRCTPYGDSPTSSRFKDTSPFTENVVPQLTPDQMAANIREEIRRLHKRKQLSYVFPAEEENTLSCHFNASMGERMVQDSSSDGNSSGAESPTPIDAPPMHRRQRTTKPERSLFTFTQVNMICERMMRERENQLREQYDQILQDKLAEQYDAFVKFTCDQLQRHVQPTQASYLS